MRQLATHAFRPNPEAVVAADVVADAVALDQPTLEAAEPFAPDFWVPGYPYRENLALLSGIPLPGGQCEPVDAD
jgi:hypothetical protein